MLSVFYAKCPAFCIVMMNVLMLNVILMSVIAPLKYQL
jgi:hypothetical protein